MITTAPIQSINRQLVRLLYFIEKVRAGNFTRALGCFPGLLEVGWHEGCTYAYAHLECLVRDRHVVLHIDRVPGEPLDALIALASGLEDEVCRVS